MSHSDSIARWATESIVQKYERGQKQHGGDVRRKNVLPHLAEELFDSVVYLAVLQEQMQLILELAEQGYDACDGINTPAEYLVGIINIIRHGNEDGIKEEERETEQKVPQFAEYYQKQIAERIFKWLTK